MHTVQRPRVGGTRTGLHQSLPHGLPAFWDEVGNERIGGDSSRATSRKFRIRGRGRLRSGRSGWNTRDLCSARRQESRTLWRLAEGSANPVVGATVERAAEVAGEF